MSTRFAGVEAESCEIGARVAIGARSRIVAREVVLGDGVVIDDDVTIVCDRLEVEAGARIGAGARIVSPDIRIGTRARIGGSLEVELHQELRLGAQADIGRGVRMTGQAVVAGDHLWLTDAVVIGGGGARGPRSQLTIGHRSAVMDRCFINVSEAVDIGDDTALSIGVTLLTHSLWQPILTGGTSVFAPTRIGSRNILYVNAIVAPGVTTGDDVTVAAGALVLQDVPDGAVAVGNPARIVKSVPPVPRELDQTRKDSLVREVLRTYAEALPVKGVTVNETADPNVLDAVFDGERTVIRYLAGDGGGDADITVGFRPADGRSGRVHFDLAACTMSGETTRLAEDLRDHLRRRTIRIFTDRPFQPLPPASIARLRQRLQPR